MEDTAHSERYSLPTEVVRLSSWRRQLRRLAQVAVVHLVKVVRVATTLRVLVVSPSLAAGSVDLTEQALDLLRHSRGLPKMGVAPERRLLQVRLPV